MNGPMEPVFMDPPYEGGLTDADVWASTQEKLIANSGQWAWIFTGDRVTTTNLAARMRSSRGSWEGHDWEAATRKIRGAYPEVVRVYARHIRSWSVPIPPPGGAG